MKKLLISLLSLVMALGLCVGCGGGNTSSSVEQSSSETSSVEDSSIDETETRLEAVKQALIALYTTESNTWDGKEALTRAGSIAIDDLSYNITWELVIEDSANVDNCIAIAKNNNGSYEVTVKESTVRPNDIAFILKATIKDKDDNQTETTFDCVLKNNGLNAAKAKLLETYPNEALEIGDTRTFAGSLTLGEVTYTLEWSFTTELKSVASAVSLTKNTNGTYTLKIKTDGSAFFDESSDVYVKAVISDGTDSVDATVTYTLTRNTFGPY